MEPEIILTEFWPFELSYSRHLFYIAAPEINRNNL